MMQTAAHWRSLFCICAVAVCGAALSACSDHPPEIVSISPSIGDLGQPLVITGRGFGDERNESYITIAGASPTSAAYISWSDAEIVVRVSEFGTPGLVRVHRGRSSSNPVLFSNQSVLPQRLLGDDDADSGVVPRIISITPASAAVGALVTITGNNFGLSRENSAALFSWNSESAAGAQPSGVVEVSALEFGYEFWSDREIRVRVPSGAVSGNVTVQTLRGASPPVFFEIAEQQGTKLFRDRRSFVLSYSVDVQAEQASIPNALYLWMPKPAVSSSQRNVKIVERTVEPFVENHRGTSLFHFSNLASGANIRVTVSYVVDVYAVETNIANQNPVNVNSPSPIRAAYTAPSPLVPSNHADILPFAVQITGTERRPYAMARRIYNWMLESLDFQSLNFQFLDFQTADIQPLDLQSLDLQSLDLQSLNTELQSADIRAETLSGGALEALQERTADSYRAALLFCALARASGIPAIPVSGVLINSRLATVRHYWAEFWLDGFGWVPVDPALGAGAAPEFFPLREDYAAFYFGNMDNQRVAFSRGEHALAQMTPGGRTVQRPRELSLQNLWEEASGALQSHSSLWSDVIITGTF
ncbi:MAG: IPT/TIG domain-containing protein [Treponema sp.]|nr:IPT/TIG domain-containing protein [Treponema sp.]